MGLETPPDETPIWRYMDLPKFVSMLATGALWFTKAATYEDPYEGFCKAVPSADHCHAGVVKEERLSPEEMTSELGSLIAANAADVCRNARDYLYVNSWCLEPESMAMWEIYGSRGCGVAVKSSVGQHRRAAKFTQRADQYAFRRVKYHHDLASSPEIQRDFKSGPIPVGSGLWPEVLNLGFHKRSCYWYEKEWRAALYQEGRPDQPEIRGVAIAFDLEQLISAVYLGPRAEDFFCDAVWSIMDKFLPGKLLERSTLLSPLRATVSAA
jgi:hypothetical protein